ncbi:MAG: DUF4388 domain-containing protein [Kofleriaceae bacterium]
MSVRGSLATMPADDVLDWIGRRRLTGVASFERRMMVRSLGLSEGNVLWASSTRKDEQLGAILTRSERVTERMLSEAVAARSQTGVPLGKVLMMAGVIDESSLVDVLATKIRETVTDVLSWRDGTFDFIPRPQPTSAGVPAILSMEVCLTIGRRRAKRLSEVLRVLGGDDACYYAPPSASPPASDTTSNVDPTRVWKLAADRRSTGDIVASMGGERFTVLDNLATMVASGRLVVDRRQRKRTDSAIELAASARGRLRDGDRPGALEMAAQALQQDSSDPEVLETHAQAERAVAAEVAKVLLSRHHVPKRTRLSPDSVALTAAEREIAARVDGRWDLLTLVRSATIREADALMAFARLAELGVIELG